MTIRFTLLLGAGVALGQDASWLRVANALDARGPLAARTEQLWWFLFAAATVVFVVVMGLLVMGLLKRGREVTDGADTYDERVRPLLFLGVGLTVAVLLVTAGLTFVAMRVMAAPADEAAYALEIIGKQWWWEVRYEGEAVTANELHLPVGVPVSIDLTSDDVIHSFWVPNLAGKRDLVPGHPNTIWLQADEPGVYRGVCAEFCGLQHAKMQFVVVAEPLGRFEAWLTRMREAARAPSSSEARAGRAVFMNEGCAGCHTVRGTAAQGQLGPDLTHLASRSSLGAATLPNTRGYLGGWIVNSQAHKPGNHMPPQNLASDDLQALLSYLATLE